MGTQAGAQPDFEETRVVVQKTQAAEVIFIEEPQTQADPTHIQENSRALLYEKVADPSPPSLVLKFFKMLLNILHQPQTIRPVNYQKCR